MVTSLVSKGNDKTPMNNPRIKLTPVSFESKKNPANTIVVINKKRLNRDINFIFKSIVRFESFLCYNAPPIINMRKTNPTTNNSVKANIQPHEVLAPCIAPSFSCPFFEKRKPIIAPKAIIPKITTNPGIITIPICVGSSF